MTSNLDKLKHLFADCLQIPIGQVTPTLSQDQLASWDSLATAMLIAELELVFEISFQIDEMLELTSFDQTVKILSDKGIPF
jgi:acyl carrier protein